MEKTLTIDGRQVEFKSTGGILMRYRNQFNSEFFADLTDLTSAADGNISKFSYAPIERIIWTLAKTADSTIPDPQTWYDSFENFDILKVWKDIAELTGKAFETLQKNA